MANMMRQPFDENGNMLCLACGQQIAHGDFCVEITQFDQVDTNLKMLVHVHCVGKLPL